MRQKLLLVEDNPELLDLLRLHLKAAGFAVATASNGIEALKKVKSLEPDLVLLDLILPELDGFAVCEVLRKTPATARTPVICLTGLSSELSRLAGYDSGANEYLVKPVDPGHLVSRIRHFLAERSARGASGRSGRVADSKDRTGRAVSQNTVAKRRKPNLN